MSDQEMQKYMTIVKTMLEGESDTAKIRTLCVANVLCEVIKKMSNHPEEANIATKNWMNSLKDSNDNVTTMQGATATILKHITP